jgi:hypothetical protein
MWVEFALLVVAGLGVAYCVRKTAQQLPHQGLVVAVWSLVAMLMASTALWGYLFFFDS